ncbi:peptidoglycan DD-metalloendopeptidase family protein [Ruminococcus sp.]|uniref:peptidoglycan DD-metalloendopeptidase family protein n=1 Tax=Ruminococcus sp. TaxID=41978 RepID=UPI001B087CB1|nr:peptidoglycan DD-metalloendopeptidase family protein [Ruminococcus sp.]MBO5559353.1 peptidoglycan DD-metalloendopeptidase family protein [Ruminococcus sp.]
MKNTTFTRTTKKVITTLTAAGCMLSVSAGALGNSTISNVIFGNAIVADAAANDASTIIDARNGNVELVQGKFYISPNKLYVLVFQGDGNLVVYHYNPSTGKAYSPTWSSQTEKRNGKKCILQGDGNFVIYRSDGKAIWNTRTNGKKNAYLTFSNSGEIRVVSRNTGSTTWSSTYNHGYSISVDERPFNWPVPDCKAISSAFNDGRNHGAIDIAAAYGTSVKAAAGGTVQTYYGYNNGAGNYVVITHNIAGATYLTVYMHLSQITVANGATVSAGTEIGKVGSTGRSTGAHLDFSIREGNYNGTRLDPGYYTNIPAGLYSCANSSNNTKNYVNEINANRNKSFTLSSHTKSNY